LLGTSHICTHAERQARSTRRHDNEIAASARRLDATLAEASRLLREQNSLEAAACLRLIHALDVECGGSHPNMQHESPGVNSTENNSACANCGKGGDGGESEGLEQIDGACFVFLEELNVFLCMCSVTASVSDTLSC
jgi:hypothetical protein